MERTLTMAEEEAKPPFSPIRGRQLAVPRSSRPWEDVKKAASLEADRGRAWYIVHCVGKSDVYAKEWLKKFAFETYYPMIREMRPVPRKKLSKKQRRSGMGLMRPHIVPLFPRYMLVRFDMARDDWREMFKFAGIGGMVCEGDLPVWLPDRLIEAIMVREVDGAVPGKLPLKVVFNVGDQVRVTDGPFASFPAIVEDAGKKLADNAIEDIDPDVRIKVAVNLFGRMTPISLQVDQIEHV